MKAKSYFLAILYFLRYCANSSNRPEGGHIMCGWDFGGNKKQDKGRSRGRRGVKREPLSEAERAERTAQRHVLERAALARQNR